MSAVVTKIKTEADEYKGGADRPLGSYAGLMATYASTITAMAVVIRRSRRQPPERVSWSDLALLALATHRLARLVTKDSVTSPLRAAFTRYEGPAGPSEVNEQVRGHGVRMAVGELLSCPFCIAQWLATVAIFGLVVAPRWTRLFASLLSVVAGADFLQFIYAKLEGD